MHTKLSLTVLAAIVLILSTTGSGAEPSTEVLSSIAALKGHIKGDAKLSDEQIGAHKETLDANAELIGTDKTVAEACMDLVTTYDGKLGPLWIARGGFNRRNVKADIHWTVYCIMQQIMDRVYTAENLARWTELLDGYKFACSARFPGAVDPPKDPGCTHTVKINGSYPKTFGPMIMHADLPARKPTGTYLAPGTIATVVVPPSLVGKGYEVRVGAHSWDMGRKPRVLRLDRCTTTFPIESTEVKVANPLGGGIYIEVPYLADAGVVDVSVRGAVRSPYFSAKSFHKTTLDEWRNVERNLKAPWADFQSDKFMMQVPTSWIYKLDDPVKLMADWDKAMDAMNDLMGRPHDFGKETMYPQVDLQLRSRVFSPGYPSVNRGYDPTKDYGGYHNNHLVRGPQYAPDYEIHEQGHGFFFSKYVGEMESAVNLLHVAVWNRKFGYSLDEAFAASRNFNKNPHRTLDNTAVTWMTSPNFANKTPMQAAEKAYQLKGHAKFVDIARLFGWESLGRFWCSINADAENGKPWPRNVADIDRYTLRLCESAGADLRPLLHFWGTPPANPESLAKAVAAKKLPASAKIYDTLVHYKSLVPKNNKAFRTFATKWWGKQPSPKGYTTERGHAAQWADFSEETSAQIAATVQEIIDLYFPDGRPAEHTEVDDPKLPRVLVIGDSISMNYSKAAKAALKGVANYHRIPDNGGPSDRGVTSIYLWLGDYEKPGSHWDVIQFNHGLHDLKQTYDKASDTWGAHQVSIEDYKKNLEKEIQILRQTGATLIWCTTTPVPNSNKGRYARRKGEAKVFNQAAMEVISKYPEIQVNDLHKVVCDSPLMDKWRKGTDVHFWSAELQAVVGGAVADAVKKAIRSGEGKAAEKAGQ